MQLVLVFFHVAYPVCCSHSSTSIFQCSHGNVSAASTKACIDT